MPFAYVTHAGSTLKKRGRRIIVQDGDDVRMSFGLAQLDSLVLRGRVHLSTAALRALLGQGVETSFLSRNGRLLGRLTAPRRGNVPLRLDQYRLQFDPCARRELARECVRDKIETMLDLLTRYAGNYPRPEIHRVRRTLREALPAADRATSLDQLLGIEGNAAKEYWSGFRALNRSDLGFYGRSRRPPRDEVNALLSLGYVLLTNELRGLLEGIGFDPFLGFYHEPKANRPSLALDLVEPFRHLVVDRFVIRAVNLGRLKESHFTGGEEHGFRLTTAGWKIFLTEYEERMLAAPAGLLADRFPHARTWRELLRKQCLAHKRRIDRLELPDPPIPGTRESASHE